jgi:multiple sugar transport system permease protein
MSIGTISAKSDARSGTAPPRRPGRRRTARSGAAKGWLFNLPYILGFLGVYVAPVVYALWQSTEKQMRSGLGFGTPRTVFAGFGNFSTVLGDSGFWSSILRVILIAVVEIPVVLGLALIMALLLDVVGTRSAKYFRLGFLVPYMVPGVVATLIWLYLYSPIASPFVSAAKHFGTTIDFFTSYTTYFSLGNVLVWEQIGFNMILIAAALQAIPRELFEAARLDGAGEARIAWSVKVPAVRPVLVFTGMFSIIAMLQLFTEPIILRQLNPGAISTTFTPMQSIYTSTFSDLNYDYAAAMSVVLALITGVLAFVFYRFTNRRAAL